MKKHKKHNLFGELVVTGTDEVCIALNGNPAHFWASFKDDCEVVPCNPHHFDALEFFVDTRFNGYHPHYVLVIKWKVSDTRKVFWEALY